MFDSEPIIEIVREYTGMDNSTGAFTSYPATSRRYDDFTRDNQQQQTSTSYSQRRNTHEMNCCYFSLAFYFPACFIINL